MFSLILIYFGGGGGLVAKLCPTHCNPMDYSPLGSFIHGKRQEYWNGLLHPPPGDLLDPGMETASPVAPALQTDSLLLSHREAPLNHRVKRKKQSRISVQFSSVQSLSRI